MKQVVRAAVAVVMVLMVAAGTTAAQPEKTGNLEVNVVVEGGGSYASCALYLKDRTTLLDKGEKTFLFENVPAGRYALTADAQVSQGWFKPKLRYLGVEDSSVVYNKTGKATVTLRRVETVDDFCRGCHPDADQPKEPGQIVRDVHTSGKVLRDKSIAQVKKYNENIDKLVKEKKPHNLPIKLEEREVIEDGKKLKRIFYTCESCHTMHFETPYTSHAVAPFRDKADLCLGCHY